MTKGTGKRSGARLLRAFLKGALLFLIVWPFAAWGAAQMLLVRAELPRADALLVLGGSSTYKERTRRAAELYREGRAPKVLLTDDNQRGGWSSVEQRNPLFVERAAEELRRQGVSPASIETLPRNVTSTYEEAVLLREYADRQGARSILVITSGYHSRRALWTMRRVFDGSGISIGLDAVPPGDDTPAPALWWLSLRGWEMVCGEYVKMVYYWAHYG